MLAFVAKLAVRIIFDNRDAVLVGQKDELVTASFGESDACRILKIRQNIHELRAGAQAGVELLGEQAIVIDGHGNVLRSVHVEGLQRAQISGCFDEHAVAAIDKHLADQIQSLLGAGGNENVLGTGNDAVASDVAGNHLAEGLIAFGRTVLQRLGAMLGEDFVASFFKARYGEDIRSWKAAAERDDSRLLRDLEKITNRRTLHSQRALRVTGLPERRHKVSCGY